MHEAGREERSIHGPRWQEIILISATFGIGAHDDGKMHAESYSEIKFRDLHLCLEAVQRI
jgi:hypothetical protein